MGIETIMSVNEWSVLGGLHCGLQMTDCCGWLGRHGQSLLTRGHYGCGVKRFAVRGSVVVACTFGVKRDLGRSARQI